jgi:hypothetical protein
MKQEAKRIAYKTIGYQLIFIVVHFLYDWFPNSITRLIGATNESVFQHMKAVFTSLLLLVIIEYILIRKSIPSLSRFSFARLFSLVIMPLMMFVYFMLNPALFVKIESIPLEIIFANLALIATSLSTFILERHVEQTEPGIGVKTVLVFLFVFSLTEFVIFTYRLPWFDVFASPPGW